MKIFGRTGMVLGIAISLWSGFAFAAADCDQALQQVRQVYAQVKACHVDAECGFVDQNLNLIAPTEKVYILTDSCSKIYPLGIANAQLYRTGKDAILQTLKQAQTACAGALLRARCTSSDGIFTTQAKAVCVQNRCRIDPTTPLW